MNYATIDNLIGCNNNLSKDIYDYIEKIKFKEATLKEYPNIFIGKCNEENTLPSYNRVVIPKKDDNNRSDFLSEDLYYSNKYFIELLEVCDKFSLKILDKCLSIANDGSLEASINHKNVNDRNDYPRGVYHYLAHPNSINTTEVSEFENLFGPYNHQSRVSERFELPSKCLFSYKNVDVYLCNSIPLIKDQKGRDIAWNLFLGEGDYIHFKKFINIINEEVNEEFTFEVDCMKPIKFPSRKNPNQFMEQGIINSFVACE